jgi:hypothetical protein
MGEKIAKGKITVELHLNGIMIPIITNEVDFNFILDTGGTKSINSRLKGLDSFSIEVNVFCFTVVA